MKKQSAFERFLLEPQEFSDGTIVISREHYSEQEATEFMNEYLQEHDEGDYATEVIFKDGTRQWFAGRHASESELKKDWARWQFHSNGDEIPNPAWTLGVGNVKNAKKVWTF